MLKKKIVVISGAGISAESGLSTFRDAGGLWEKHDINEVASIEGWKKNPEKVLEFYNLRRKQAAEAKPNKAHLALAKLEKLYEEVVVITQNVDDLHERGGSGNVIHLHGELCKARSERDELLITDIGDSSIKLGDKAEDGCQLRPHIVWFGELVPMMEKAATEVENADILIIVGTSLMVYPAAGLVNLSPLNIPKYIIDPADLGFLKNEDWIHYKENAGTGVVKLVQKLTR
ncbi:MAG: NAD-dependent deacylase [Balneolaceae bacterium]